MTLEQLLSDEPLSDAYEYVNNSHTFANDLKYLSQNEYRQWKAPPPHEGPFSVFEGQNPQPTPLYQSNDALNRTAVALPRLRVNAWITATNRIANVNNDRINAMHSYANENTIWNPEIDKLVSELPLSKIRLLGRM